MSADVMECVYAAFVVPRNDKAIPSPELKQEIIAWLGDPVFVVDHPPIVLFQIELITGVPFFAEIVFCRNGSASLPAAPIRRSACLCTGRNTRLCTGTSRLRRTRCRQHSCGAQRERRERKITTSQIILVVSPSSLLVVSLLMTAPPIAYVLLSQHANNFVASVSGSFARLASSFAHAARTRCSRSVPRWHVGNDGVLATARRSDGGKQIAG